MPPAGRLLRAPRRPSERGLCRREVEARLRETPRPARAHARAPVPAPASFAPSAARRSDPRLRLGESEGKLLLAVWARRPPANRMCRSRTSRSRRGPTQPPAPRTATRSSPASSGALRRLCASFRVPVDARLLAPGSGRRPWRRLIVSGAGPRAHQPRPRPRPAGPRAGGGTLRAKPPRPRARGASAPSMQYRARGLDRGPAPQRVAAQAGVAPGRVEGVRLGQGR